VRRRSRRACVDAMPPKSARDMGTAMVSEMGRGVTVWSHPSRGLRSGPVDVRCAD
jgi:hypothetical protein